jgi:hypothetical protein
LLEFVPSVEWGRRHVGDEDCTCVKCHVRFVAAMMVDRYVALQLAWMRNQSAHDNMRWYFDVMNARASTNIPQQLRFLRRLTKEMWVMLPGHLESFPGDRRFFVFVNDPVEGITSYVTDLDVPDALALVNSRGSYSAEVERSDDSGTEILVAHPTSAREIEMHRVRVNPDAAGTNDVETDLMARRIVNFDNTDDVRESVDFFMGEGFNTEAIAHAFCVDIAPERVVMSVLTELRRDPRVTPRVALMAIRGEVQEYLEEQASLYEGVVAGIMYRHGVPVHIEPFILRAIEAWGDDFMPGWRETEGPILRKSIYDGIHPLVSRYRAQKDDVLRHFIASRQSGALGYRANSSVVPDVAGVLPDAPSA